MNLTINCSLDEKDFLTHLLYTASKSDAIKKSRKRSKISIPIFCIIWAIIFAFNNELVGFIITLSIGLLWFIFYPFWEKEHYVKSYKSFIDENYKNRFNQIVNIEFNNNFIFEKDFNGTETKILTTEINEIIEIPSLILIKLNSGASLILPKSKINDLENVKTFLKELSGNLKINYSIDEKWRWK